MPSNRSYCRKNLVIIGQNCSKLVMNGISYKTLTYTFWIISSSLQHYVFKLVKLEGLVLKCHILSKVVSDSLPKQIYILESSHEALQYYCVSPSSQSERVHGTIEKDHLELTTHSACFTQSRAKVIASQNLRSEKSSQFERVQ